jgi:hypothetical protein
MTTTENLQCGCCGRTLPARGLTELASTPGVYICSGCAVWAARRASRLPDLRRVARRVAHHGLGLLAGRHRRATFRSAIPILPSGDLDRTTGFWRAVGFEVVERYDDYLVIHADGVELHFTTRPEGDEAEGRDGRRPGLAFVHVRDALVLWKRLRSADLAGLGPVQDTDFRLREFVVTDPDANLVRFGSPLPAPAEPASS